MTNRSVLNRWIELINDNVYKSPRGPAYFKHQHVKKVSSKVNMLSSDLLALRLRSCLCAKMCLRCIQNINKSLCV